MELIWFGSKSKLANVKQRTSTSTTDSVHEQASSLIVSCQCFSMLANCHQHPFFSSVACISSGGCSTRRRNNDSFLHLSYHASTSAMPRSLASSLHDRTSSMYFCNAALTGLPACMIAPPVCTECSNTVHFRRAGSCSHHRHHAVTTLAASRLSDSLQAQLRLVFYAVYNSISPAYIADTTTRISMLASHCWLQSANTSKFDILCTRTKFGEISLRQDHENGTLHRSLLETPPKYLLSSVP